METYPLLLLEDKQFDAEPVIKPLQRSGMAFATTIPYNEQCYHIALQDDNDATPADNFLPQFNAMEALKIYQSLKATYLSFLLLAPFSEELIKKR